MMMMMYIFSRRLWLQIYWRKRRTSQGYRQPRKLQNGILETVQDRDLVTTGHEQEMICGLSNCSNSSNCDECMWTNSPVAAFSSGILRIFCASRQDFELKSTSLSLPTIAELFSRACRTLRGATQVVTFLSVRDKKLFEAQSPSNHSPSWAPLLIAAHRLARPWPTEARPYTARCSSLRERLCCREAWYVRRRLEAVTKATRDRRLGWIHFRLRS